MTWQGWPKSIRHDTKAFLAAALWELHLNGPAESSSGTAVRVLVDRLAKRDPELATRVNPAYLVRMAAGGHLGTFLERDAREKSCYAIRLVVPVTDLPPPPWPIGLQGEEPTENEQPSEPEPTPAPLVEPPDDDLRTDPAPIVVESEQLDASAATNDSPVDRLLLIQRLATEVLFDVVGLAGRSRPTDEVLTERLGDALDESQRLRAEVARLKAKLSDVEETMRAKVHETTDLRRALRLTSANLDALRTGAQVHDEGFRALNRLMRETPAASRMNGGR